MKFKKTFSQILQGFFKHISIENMQFLIINCKISDFIFHRINSRRQNLFFNTNFSKIPFVSTCQVASVPPKKEVEKKQTQLTIFEQNLQFWFNVRTGSNGLF